MFLQWVKCLPTSQPMVKGFLIWFFDCFLAVWVGDREVAGDGVDWRVAGGEAAG